MVWPLVAAAVISAAGAAYSAYAQSKAANMAGDFGQMQGLLAADAQAKAGVSKMIAGYTRARLLRMEGQAIGEQMDLKMGLIKDRARLYRGKQKAIMSASGVEMNSGSLQAVLDQTFSLASRDAYVTMRLGLDQQTNKEFDAVNNIKIGNTQFEQAFMAGVNDRVNADYAVRSADLKSRTAIVVGAANTASSLFSAYGNSGAFSAGGGGGQTAAPIEERSTQYSSLLK